MAAAVIKYGRVGVLNLLLNIVLFQIAVPVVVLERQRRHPNTKFVNMHPMVRELHVHVRKNYGL
jgi:hypothetical protein